MKELPKMYHSNIDKELNNNEKIFSTMFKNNIKEIINKKIKNNKSIENKIQDIFNSPNYIYKMDVVIETDTGSLNKRIVAKTKTDLITMDNEYIPINSIRDIYIKR